MQYSQGGIRFPRGRRRRQTRKTKTSIVMQRWMASRCAGVDDPLFYKDCTRLKFGDAKEMLAALKG